MNYELAKRLKDAGFANIKICEGKGKPDHYDAGCDEKLPTLLELIAALQSRYKNIQGLINDAQFVLRKTFINGGKVGYLACLDGDWESFDMGMKYYFHSETPEECVAKLWLALNEK